MGTRKRDPAVVAAALQMLREAIDGSTDNTNAYVNCKAAIAHLPEEEQDKAVDLFRAEAMRLCRNLGRKARRLPTSAWENPGPVAYRRLTPEKKADLFDPITEKCHDHSIRRCGICAEGTYR